MKSERYSKFLAGLVTSLIIISLFIPPALAAAPNNSANLAPEFSRQSLMSPGDTTRVSVASDGAQGNNASGKPSTSADGRYIAFESNASNLVSGDTNGYWDVFVRDTVENTTTRVSVATGGAQGNGDSFGPSISADGRYVVFHSDASNLVSGDINGKRDVFVRDTVANTTALVSADSSGAQGNNDSFGAAISADGHYVIFASNASNLVSGDTNGKQDVFIRDIVASITTRASVSSSGVEGNSDSGWWSPYDLAISADGRYVVFGSYASNLVTGDTNGAPDEFLRDTVANTTIRVSVNSSGVQEIGGGSYNPSISADGRYIAFASDATNLVSGDTNGTADVFVRDIIANTTKRVSVNSSDLQGNSGSYNPSISANGRFVAFMSYASNLVSGDTDGATDVFVRDTVTNTTTRISLASSGAQGNANSYSPSISADGHFVAFISDANNLVSGDTNGYSDVFVHENDMGAFHLS
jgi:Tol biopolymer transport system component